MKLLPGIYLRRIFVLIAFFCSPTVMSQSSVQIDSLRKALEISTSDEDRISILGNLAEEWAALNFDSAMAYATRLQLVSQQHNNPKYEILANRMIGFAYDYSYKADSARHYYLKALDLAYTSNDTVNIAASSFNLGTLELFNGNYLKVLPWYEQALEFFKDRPENRESLVKLYNNLGIVYRRIDRPDEAIAIYRRALEVLDKEKDKKQIINIYINMGNAQTSVEQYDSAEMYFRMVYDYSMVAEDDISFYFANNGLGIIAEAQKKPEEALIYFKRSLTKKVEDKYVLFTALRFIGSTYSQLGRYDSAEYFFQQAIPIYSESDYPHQVKELYLQMADHYERLGRAEEALSFYKKYYTLKDELISQKVIDRTAEWEERFKAQEKENEIINLKLRNEEASLLAQQQTNQRNIFISISIVLGLIGGFSFYLYKAKQKVSLRLAEKNKLINQALADKELLMKEVHHRVKNNLQVISSLLNLQSNFIADEKANAAVMESKNRVHSMALIHQRLYQHEGITTINLEEYLDQLIGNLEQSYCGSERDIVINLEADDITLDVDKVILLGLIVNELVTNSIKYAFDQGVRSGVIDVSVCDLDGKIRLSVADNGKGMEAPPEVRHGSLGTLLIKDLSKKLNADLKYEFGSGTKVILVFEHQSAFA